jgi:hypothetical protein
VRASITAEVGGGIQRVTMTGSRLTRKSASKTRNSQRCQGFWVRPDARRLPRDLFLLDSRRVDVGWNLDSVMQVNDAGDVVE